MVRVMGEEGQGNEVSGGGDGDGDGDGDGLDSLWSLV